MYSIIGLMLCVCGFGAAAALAGLFGSLPFSLPLGEFAGFSLIIACLAVGTVGLLMAAYATFF